MKKTIFQCLLVLCGIVYQILSFAGGSSAGEYYRTFWYPTYKGKLVSWCYYNTPVCGKNPADRYCQLMGYERSVGHQVNYDVGDARYLKTGRLCTHWTCDAFRKIKCINHHLKHSAYYTSYAKKKEFAYPRFNQRRVDSCYKKGNKVCGRKAAYSFCRQSGYRTVANYRIDKSAASTQRIGDKSLCGSVACHGFRHVVCMR